MTNNQVVELFENGLKGASLNMTSTGDKLYSYNTIIAQWINGKIIVNACKYSATTSKHTSSLKRKGYKTTNKDKWIPFNESNLTDYL